MSGYWLMCSKMFHYFGLDLFGLGYQMTLPFPTSQPIMLGCPWAA